MFRAVLMEASEIYLYSVGTCMPSTVSAEYYAIVFERRIAEAKKKELIRSTHIA